MKRKTRMINIGKKWLAVFLAWTFVLPSLTVGVAAAQEGKPALKDATEAEVSLLNRLAKSGFLGDKKAAYLKARSLTGEEVVAALVVIEKELPTLQGNGTQAGGHYTEEDLKGLLELIKGRKDDLWDKKVQVWSFEKRAKDMMASVGRLAASSSAKAVPDRTEEEPQEKAEPALKPTPLPTPVPTPVPEVTQAELDEVVSQLRDLSKKLEAVGLETDRKLEKAAKDAAEVERTAQENLEQLRILKKLVDQVQDNLTKTGERLEAVSQKASQKALADDELRRDLTILRKDVRDNSQDISVLNQEMAKLEQKKTPKGQSPLDEALGSPWLAGGALVVGLAALIVSVTK